MPVLTLLAALSAGAWSTTFEPNATASYLDRPNAAVLVVGAGEKSASTDAASQAIVMALRTSGKARLVMTPESLAVGATDSDADLVKKASVLPVDLVIVVRTFPGATETAVATVYDKSGTAVSAMAGSAGQVLTVRETRLTSNAGRDAISTTVKAQQAKDVDRAFDPEDEHITFGRGATVDLRTGQVMSVWVTPVYKGRMLTGQRLYEVVGREDLVKQYKGRMGLKIGLSVGGGVLALAGPIVGLLTQTSQYSLDGCAIYDRAAFRCIQPKTPSLLVPGIIVGVAGLAALMVGLFYPADPVGMKERYALIADHNKRLDDKASAPSSAAPAVEVHFAIAPAPGGFATSLSLTF